MRIRATGYSQGAARERLIDTLETTFSNGRVVFIQRTDREFALELEADGIARQPVCNAFAAASEAGDSHFSMVNLTTDEDLAGFIA